MTRLEQQVFVKDLMQSFQSSMDADFNAGNIPAHWSGKQLRMYVSDRVKRNAYWNMTRKETSDFENDCIINNL